MYPGSGEVQLLSTFPGMGSSPLCWGQSSVCVPGEGPLFPCCPVKTRAFIGRTVWKPQVRHLLQGVWTGPGGVSPPWLPAYCCFCGVLWLASAHLHQVPQVPKGEVCNPLEVTTNSFQGYPLRRGNYLSRSQLGPCIFISSQVPPIMS